MLSKRAIYLAHPISGLSYDSVVNYYDDITHKLQGEYETLNPMTGKGCLRNEVEFKSHGYDQFPVSTNHAIYERDKWMVENCDILLCDLSGKTGFAIGCTMELAWAALLGVHTIVVMPKDSEYRHAFILEAADLVFETMDEALIYLHNLYYGSYNAEKEKP